MAKRTAKQVPSPAKPDPATPVAAYKAIVDDLVEVTKEYGAAHSVRTAKIISNAPSDKPANALVRSLTPEQRELFADVLAAERRGAVHHVFSRMEWWASCRGLAFTYRGEPVDVQVFEGLLGDYVGRLDGWVWPDERDVVSE